MVFERIKFLASDVAPKPEETTYWVDIWSNPYGGVIKYYNGEDWVKLDQLTVAEDYRRLRFKPTLNGVTIEDDKTSIDYKIPSKEELDNVLNDFEQELNVIVNKTNQVITDLNQHITTADADFTKIKADITNIKESLQLIIGPSASQVIDKFNELISFLEGYNDDAKLKTILTALENKLTTLIQNIETDVDLQKKEIMAALNEHKNNTANPHNVTKTQVGLGNVDNTSDLNKPVSTATQQAITNEATTRANKDKELEASITVNTNDLSKVKQQINTIQSTVDRFDDTYIPLSQKGIANGVASLNENGIVPPNMLPAFNDEVIECFATFTKNPDGSLTDIHLYEDEQHQREIQGEASKIYIDITVRTLYNRAVNDGSTPSEITDNVLNNYQAGNTQLFSNMPKGAEQTVFGNYQFRWTGTQFAVINASTVIGEITGTAYDGGKGKQLENKINIIDGDINTAGSFRKADKDLETTLNNKIATDINTAKTQIQSGNVATATKLKTPVSLWGNSFDGSSDINGALTVNDLFTIKTSTGELVYSTMEENSFRPGGNNSESIDLGAPDVKWRDLYLSGVSSSESLSVINNASIGGELQLEGNITMSASKLIDKDNQLYIGSIVNPTDNLAYVNIGVLNDGKTDLVNVASICYMHDSEKQTTSFGPWASSDRKIDLGRNGASWSTGYIYTLYSNETIVDNLISKSAYDNGYKEKRLINWSWTTTNGDETNIFVPGNTTTQKISLRGAGLILSVGKVSAPSGFYEESDERLKTNIKPIEQKGNIELVEFDWKESGKHSYGVIAQQIEKDYPELVDGTGEYKTVKYDSVLIVKCAQLEERINKLEKELEELKNGKDSN